MAEKRVITINKTVTDLSQYGNGGVIDGEVVIVNGGSIDYKGGITINGNLTLPGGQIYLPKGNLTVNGTIFLNCDATSAADLSAIEKFIDRTKKPQLNVYKGVITAQALVSFYSNLAANELNVWNNNEFWYDDTKQVKHFLRSGNGSKEAYDVTNCHSVFNVGKLAIENSYLGDKDKLDCNVIKVGGQLVSKSKGVIGVNTKLTKFFGKPEDWPSQLEEVVHNKDVGIYSGGGILLDGSLMSVTGQAWINTIEAPSITLKNYARMVDVIGMVKTKRLTLSGRSELTAGQLNLPKNVEPEMDESSQIRLSDESRRGVVTSTKVGDEEVIKIAGMRWVPNTKNDATTSNGEVKNKAPENYQT